MDAVDVIIPTYKPDKRLFQLIEMLDRQTVPVNQIILMNTEEKYFDLECYGNSQIRHRANITIRHQSKREFDHGRTRGMGVKRSESPIFICMTQDAIPENEFMIEELVKALISEGVAIAYARQLPDETCSTIERYTRNFNYPAESRLKGKEDIGELGIKTYFCSNVCAAYKRNIYEELGGFIKHTIFNEDMIYAAGAVKAGYQIAYVSSAKVIHSHNYTNGQQFHRNFDLGVSQADHPEVFEGFPSESEGRKLVRDTRQYLKKNGKARLIPYLYIQSCCKYLGYQLGKHYRTLPGDLRIKFSMDKDYWIQDNLRKDAAGIDATRGYGKTEEESIRRK